MACSTRGSWRICSVRKASRSRVASVSMPRLRPAFLSRPRSWVKVSRAAPGRGGGGGQDGAGVGAADAAAGVGVGGQEAGEVLAQVRAELVLRAGAVPNRVLPGAGQHRNSLASSESAGSGRCRSRSVRSTWASATESPWSDFPPRHRVPVPVAGHRHRVDRVDRQAGGAQARDQQAAGRLDRHRDRVTGGVAVLGEQVQQRREPGRAVADPAAGPQLAVQAGQGDVVVIFGPVDSFW